VNTLFFAKNHHRFQSPKFSMLGLYLTGHGSKASGAQLSIGFGPHSPDYAQIAVAASAGWAWGKHVGKGGREARQCHHIAATSTLVRVEVVLQHGL
jgi:hypothetical protein